MKQAWTGLGSGTFTYDQVELFINTGTYWKSFWQLPQERKKGGRNFSKLLVTTKNKSSFMKLPDAKIKAKKERKKVWSKKISSSNPHNVLLFSYFNKVVITWRYSTVAQEAPWRYSTVTQEAHDGTGPSSKKHRDGTLLSLKKHHYGTVTHIISYRIRFMASWLCIFVQPN